MKISSYTSKEPNKAGFVDYNDEEQAVWERLYTRQMNILPTLACKEYLEGIEQLNITANTIPQIPDINRRLKRISGWEVKPVPALIGFKTFFTLLANKQFPAATFIRREEDLDYLQEPDIFHEIFGHCPLITVPAYAEFMQRYGELGLKVDKAQRSMLARLYWFTIEFGLMQTQQGLRIYGGGILSSHGESQYTLSEQPIHKALDTVDVFRTPYRIDIMQPVYFIIKEFNQLFDIIEQDLLSQIKVAQSLGMHQPLFEPKSDENDIVC